ncbi:MAG: 1-deoxy-D-xylulose-5-phosphate reductoisomerase [Planctomycetaceae bacterium]
MKQIAVLGSTGSIGTSCLDVIAAHRDRMQLVAITAHNNWEALARQSRAFHPRWAVVGDASLKSSVCREDFSPETEVLFGSSGIEKVASESAVDVVVSGIVGAAGLRGTWAAVEAGKTVALANKETLVVAGGLIYDLARRTGARLIPVDSEHSAVFQAMQGGKANEVRRVVLTASGGPFRGKSRQELNGVTPAMALAHPTWEMGPKITVDSATMMNKALEVIEAKWLFGLSADQIEVVIHPQSIVHSMVEFVDGSVVAQLSPPDMKLPIQYAITYPERLEGISPKMDWKRGMQLDFCQPDLDAFPALELGYEVVRRGGTSGAVLNAANEVAVQRFLANDLGFNDIPRAASAILNNHEFNEAPTLGELFELDEWAREETRRWRS